MPPFWSGRRDSNSRPSPWQGDALPLSHFRIKIWWRGTESNCRHRDFQSPALPTELPRHLLAEPTGLEPATSGVTGRHPKPTRPRLHVFLIAGGRNRARTCDPLLVRQVLSQLSYSPFHSGVNHYT